MGFGSVLSNVLETAGERGADILTQMGQAAAGGVQAATELAAQAQAAASRAVQKAAAVALAAKRQTVAAAGYVRDEAVAAVAATREGASFLARKAGAAGLLGTESVVLAGVGVAGTGAVFAGKAYGRVAQTLRDIKQTFSPAVAVAYPCIPCLAQDSALQRRERMLRRKALIADSRHSADPSVQAAAHELESDMHAVELARLSDNVYAQYDPKKTDDLRRPPEPGTAIDDPDKLAAMGVVADDVRAAKAVVYQAPSDFPFDPKTVVAFRGTTADPEDILADHDQALGLQTRQYKAARELGLQLEDSQTPVQLTGHSLGGGKAQAAGVAGNLPGMMFNSAGLHPRSVGYDSTAQLAPYVDNFVQYRAVGGLAQGGGDPLTGLQNSLAAQTAAFGLVGGLENLGKANQWALAELGIDDPLSVLPAQHQPLGREIAERLLHVTRKEAAANFRFSAGQWYLPPALGEVRGLASKTLSGEDAALADQHSLVSLINGFEHRKSDDLQTMLDAAGMSDRKADYIGPMRQKS